MKKRAMALNLHDFFMIKKVELDDIKAAASIQRE